jgi:transcriptional regulator with XRE-family HTH domain
MAKGDFSEWLQSELDKRGWRQADLARRSGIHTGHLSKVLSRERMPGVEFCNGVALAFGLPEIEVLQHAGLVSASPQETPGIKELVYQFSQLSDEDQQTILAIVRGLREQRTRYSTHE